VGAVRADRNTSHRLDMAFERPQDFPRVIQDVEAAVIVSGGNRVVNRAGDEGAEDSSPALKSNVIVS
jgi:hypothetical protein